MARAATVAVMFDGRGESLLSVLPSKKLSVNKRFNTLSCIIILRGFLLCN